MRYWILALWLAAAHAAWAQTKTFDVPAQPAATGVPAFARQADVQLLISAADASGRRTNAVKGTYEVPEALNLLLADTGLGARAIGSSTWTIVALKDAARSSSQDKDSAQRSEGIRKAEVITVTGTNIKGTAASAVSVTTMTREDLERGGFADLGQAIRSLPVNFGGGVNPENRLGGGTGEGAANNRPGVASPNLRGLGSGATLTLLNGKRLPLAGQGLAVDLNLIPLSAIERVEVLADGASAIYGADAVAGVVNIITRRRLDGLEARASYGSAEDGLGIAGASVLAGFDSGPIYGVIGAQYSNQAKLDASKRYASRDVPLPFDLAGEIERKSFMASLNYEINSRLEAYLDGFYTQSSGETVSTNVSRTTITQLQEAAQYTAAFGIRALLFRDWDMDLFATASKTVSKYPFFNRNAAGTVSFVELDQDRVNQPRTIESRFTGTLFDVPGGSVKAAAGLAYRNEKYFSRTSTTRQERNVRSAYVELEAPVVTNGLVVSLAGRTDDYSEFGQVSVPKVGATWRVTRELSFGATYSKSFRAPSLFDEAPSYFAQIRNVTDSASPGGVTRGMYLGGPGAPLGPERAEGQNINVSYIPRPVPGLELSLGYYKVDYRNRIANPDPTSAFAFNLAGAPADLVTRGASQALVQALFNGSISRTASGVPLDPTLVTTIIDMRNTNIAVSTIRGLQGRVGYKTPVARGTLDLSVDAAYIDRFTDTLREGLAPVERAGIIYSPAKLKSRIGAQWSNERYGAALFWNHTDSYLDKRVASAPREVQAWNTADASLSYTPGNRWGFIGKGARMVLSVTNLLNADPPETPPLNTGSLIRWDATNASIIGRFAKIELIKRW